MNKKSKVPKTKVKKPKVETMKFKPSQQRMFREIIARHQRELNEALQEVYDELGLTERIRAGKEEFEILPNFNGIRIIKDKKDE